MKAVNIVGCSGKSINKQTNLEEVMLVEVMTI
jgi:hypothetical protein